MRFLPSQAIAIVKNPDSFGRLDLGLWDVEFCIYW